MRTPDLIRRLMCNFREPDEEEWRVYYTKQIHPQWSLKELSHFFNTGKSTIHRILTRFKMTPRNFHYLPRDNMKKIFKILEEEPLRKNLWTFIQGINYCPALPHPEDAHVLIDILPAIENQLLPEILIYLYSLILEQPQKFKEYPHAELFERFMAIRTGFLARGLMYSYHLATIPFLIASTQFSYPIEPNEYEYVAKNLHLFPPFYRNLLSRYKWLLHMALNEISIRIPEKNPADAFTRFILELSRAHYEKSLQIPIKLDELSREERQLYEILKTILNMFLSSRPPSPPHYNFEPTSQFISMHIIHSKLIYARLRGIDPTKLLESEPLFHLHRHYIEKTFLNPDPHFIESEGKYPGKEMLILLARGEIDKAWVIARKQGYIYDFHSNYIAMGYPLIDLMIKYKLRIKWIKPEIEIHPGRLIIKYAGDKRIMRGNIADILRDIVNGNGYLGNRELKILYRLRFLMFRKKRYNGGKKYVKLEDDAVVKVMG